MASVEKYKSIRNCTSLETPGSVSFGKPRPPASGLVTGAGSHLQFALANSLPRVPAKCARGRMASCPARTAPGRPLSASFSTREHSLFKVHAIGALSVSSQKPGSGQARLPRPAVAQTLQHRDFAARPKVKVAGAWRARPGWERPLVRLRRVGAFREPARPRPTE